MELTADSVEYRAAGDEQGQPPGAGEQASPELAAQELAALGQHSSEGRN
jgi:hypothetical protein